MIARRNTRPLIVTTSWDDGHSLDLRLAELLARHGIRGTFYVPLENGANPTLDRSQLNSLAAQGMEIGAHTVTHAPLTRLSRARVDAELRDSKMLLEDMVGRPVGAFCYPRGELSRRVKKRVAAAGYSLARTTVSLRTGTRFDPMAMPVSLQARPHSRSVRLRHGLKSANGRGLGSWVLRYRAENDWDTLALCMFERVINEGGILHLWGHSWEIERLGLWTNLDTFLGQIGGQPTIQYLTNSETLSAVSRLWAHPDHS